MSDDSIDTDDIPERDPAGRPWGRRPGLAHRGGVARLDKDVLDWCLSRMGDSDLDVIVNGALRSLMRLERDLAARAAA